MSTFLKILVVVVIIAGIGFAAYLGGYIPLNGSKKTAVEQSTQTATTTPEQLAQQPIGGMTALTEISDTALMQDVSAIDTHIQNLTTDASSLDASFTDKQITQSY
ncbi:MAG: hypothetical protein QG621_442 [Patescibacteria group bacterium]|jgi:hypothetical protein|nr:hypothetical protein [Patescibacteria group bacterium]